MGFMSKIAESNWGEAGKICLAALIPAVASSCAHRAIHNQYGFHVEQYSAAIDSRMHYEHKSFTYRRTTDSDGQTLQWADWATIHVDRKYANEEGTKTNLLLTVIKGSPYTHTDMSDNTVIFVDLSNDGNLDHVIYGRTGKYDHPTMLEFQQSDVSESPEDQNELFAELLDEADKGYKLKHPNLGHNIHDDLPDIEELERISERKKLDSIVR